jgi:hypothetical protein
MDEMGHGLFIQESNKRGLKNKHRQEGTRYSPFTLKAFGNTGKWFLARVGGTDT